MQQQSSQRTSDSSSVGATPMTSNDTQVPEGGDHAVFATNLPRPIESSQLVTAFGPYGTVVEVDPFLAKDGTPMGCAMVRFETAEQAADAIDKCHNTVMFPSDGKRVAVKLWQSPSARVRQRQQQQLREAQRGNVVLPSNLPPGLPPIKVGGVFVKGCGGGSESGESPSTSVKAATTTSQGPSLSSYHPSQPLPTVWGAPSGDAQLYTHVAVQQPTMPQPPREQPGDLVFYNGPLSQETVFHLLASRYGPVHMVQQSSVIPGAFVARMQDTNMHYSIASQLHGALLNTGHSLSVALLT